MMEQVLRCECGNETEFFEETIVNFICDTEGNREEKTMETTVYYCIKCKAEVFFFGD